MKKYKSRLGFSMAEMLIVVAIIAVLGGVSFIAVWNYQRSLGQLERDNIAKEIFVAAQNHLTAVYGEGYLEVTDFGTPGNYAEDYDNPEKTETWKDIYYCIANGTPEETSMIGQMLPFGAIDETVRSGDLKTVVRLFQDLETFIRCL